MADLTFHPLTPFGFSVELSSPELTEAQADALRRHFRQDGLLLIRGLRLSHPEQIAFCRHFGPVPDSPGENFIVSNVEKDGLLGARELLFHNDVPFLPSPWQAACLHAVDVDPEAIGTRFASGYRALERLPADLARRIEGLKGLHIRERVFDRPNRLTDLIDGDICTVHDVVRTDPETGRRYLFVNQPWMAMIIGLPEAESRALHDELSRQFYAPDNVYEHKWAEGDMVLWNNLAVQHARGEAGRGNRTLQRVTIAELTYGEQYPTDVRAIYEGLHNDVMLADAG